MKHKIWGKCYEECFQYYEVMCFKTYPYEYQNILLKLAFFNKINKDLLMSVFGYNEKESYRIINELTNFYGALVFEGEENYYIEDFLRLFLQKRQRAYLGMGEMGVLYQQAYAYFKQEKAWMEAIRYAQLNGDIRAIIECMKEYCISNTLHCGYMELESYMHEVPESYIVDDPVLLYMYTMMEVMHGNKEQAEYYVHLIKKYLTCLSKDTEEYKQFYTADSVLQIMLPYKDPIGCIEQLISLAEEENLLQYNVSLSGGIPSFLHGQRDLCVFMNHGSEVFHSIRGVLKPVLADNYEGFEDVILGEIAYEQGELEEAIKFLTKGTACANPNSETKYVGNILLLKIMYIKNRSDQAESIFKRIQEEFKEKKNVFMIANMKAFGAYLALLQGNVDYVKEWMMYESIDEHKVFYMLYWYCYSIKIYGYIVLDQSEDALLLLHRMLAFCKEYNRKYDEWFLRILEVIICYRNGEEEWMEQLETLLGETIRYGLVRIYADRGALLYPVLKNYEELRRKRKTDDSALDVYYKKIFEETKKMALLYPFFMAKKKEYEELSTQEIDVLRLLCHGKKNVDIAKELFLSENTVKYHLKKIYQKLQVTNRSEAIARAGELNLL